MNYSKKDSVRFLPPPQWPKGQGKQGRGANQGKGNQGGRKFKGRGQNRGGQGGSVPAGGVRTGSIAGGSIAAVLFWLVVAIVLIAFAAGIIWAIIQMVSKDDETDDQVPVDSDQKAKETSVERLPFKVNKPVGDFLASARTAFGSGNYREAMNGSRSTLVSFAFWSESTGTRNKC